MGDGQKDWVIMPWVRDCDLEDLLNSMPEYRVARLYRNCGSEETTTVLFKRKRA